MSGYLASIVARTQVAPAVPRAPAAAPPANPFEALDQTPDAFAPVGEPAGDAGAFAPSGRVAWPDAESSSPKAVDSVGAGGTSSLPPLGLDGPDALTDPQPAEANRPMFPQHSSPPDALHAAPPIFFQEFREDQAFENKAPLGPSAAQQYSLPPGFAVESVVGPSEPLPSVATAGFVTAAAVAAPSSSEWPSAGLSVAPPAPHITIGRITVQVATVTERAPIASRPAPQRAAHPSPAAQAPLRLRLGLGQM